MKTQLKILGTISIISIFLTSDVFASKVKVVNFSNDNIQLAFRGKGKSKHYDIVVADKEIRTCEITPEHIENMPVFEAIASTSVGNPDWKLLGGLCTNLKADENYILLIESTAQGLKTSCTALME